MLKDRDGKLSMGRVGALIVLLLAIAWNVISMIKYEPLPVDTLTGLGVLLGIFAGWTTGTKVTKSDVNKE